ncbi:MAG: NTP transferase domain-containing protein [Rhodopseudomonas sp.]|nr:NTP transferase domain-containing protein [Rhodopseudomonas sp.]
MRVLAVIPARGGSKGIPRKNIVPLAGRPLIAYTLDAARQSTAVSDILVTTDDDEIAALCESLGVAVPYRRPDKLGGDAVGMVDTVIHALDWWAALNGGDPDLVVLLQPTSPLRVAADIDGAVRALSDSGKASAISVHRLREHPMESVRVTGDSWAMLERPPAGANRRQDYNAEFQFINGAIYAVTPRFLRERRAFMTEGHETALYTMPALRGLDIDYPEDLDLAEAILGHARLSANIQQQN